MAAEPLAQRAAPERPLRVLVVDANTTARNHVQLSLGEGYAVDCVSTLDEAITELHRMRRT